MSEQTMTPQEVLAVLDQMIVEWGERVPPLEVARAAVAELVSEVERLRIFHDASASCINELTADRLDAVAVSDAMVERAAQVLHDSKFQFSHPRMGIKTFLWNEAGPEWKANACKEMRAALESILPIADEQVRKDAARYNWLKKHAHVDIFYKLGHGFAESEAAIDRAIASAKGDDK